MATATSNVVEDNSSLANFKSWGQFISNNIGSGCCNWTQTGDTGQVNWSTIVSVPSSTYVYEIWKAADALASAMPIYIKIEYGFSSSNPSIRFTVGTGSNGSGTINGVVLTGFNPVSTGNLANGGATTFPCYVSGDTSEFRVLMWNGTANAQYFAVERSKDASGNNTNAYVTALCMFKAANQGIQQTMTATQQTLAESGGPVSTGSSSITGCSFNGTVCAFPIFPLIGELGNPMLGSVVVNNNDVADDATVTVASMYGSTHTYKSCKWATTGWNALTRGFGQNGAALMRYE